VPDRLDHFRTGRGAAREGRGARRAAARAGQSDVGPLGAFFLLPDRPEVFNLPSKPVLPSRFQPAAYTSGLLAAAALALVGMRVFRGAGDGA